MEQMEIYLFPLHVDPHGVQVADFQVSFHQTVKRSMGNEPSLESR